MRTTDPGRITDDIIFFGTRGSCLYLLKINDGHVLIEAGLAHVLPDFLSQLEASGIDEKSISRIIILHAHFDHLGLLPALKRRWPWAVITASKRAAEMLQTPRVVATIIQTNLALAKINGRADYVNDENLLDFTGIRVDEAVSGGEAIDLGGTSLEIIDTPGHSSCSIAAYVPEIKALFGSDAAGIPQPGGALTVASSNFDHYQNSLERMADRDVDIYLAGHYGAMTGEDALKYLNTAKKSAAQIRSLVDETWIKTHELDACAQKAYEARLAATSSHFLPESLVRGVTRQMVKNMLKSQGLLKDGA